MKRIRHRLLVTRERFWLRLSRFVPKRLAYWCAVRVWSYATSGPYKTTNVKKIPFGQGIQRFYADLLAPRR